MCIVVCCIFSNSLSFHLHLLIYVVQVVPLIKERLQLECIVCASLLVLYRFLTIQLLLWPFLWKCFKRFTYVFKRKFCFEKLDGEIFFMLMKSTWRCTNELHVKVLNKLHVVYGIFEFSLHWHRNVACDTCMQSWITLHDRQYWLYTLGMEEFPKNMGMSINEKWSLWP